MINYSKNNRKKNSVRIIAGKWRNRTLVFADDVESLRPTSGRVRETVFNWLQPKITGARCLDLFAGSGAMAFEACSRGAVSLTVLDRSSRVTEMIKKNCRALDCQSMEVILTDSMCWLELPNQSDQFDIVFLDPPYSLNLLPDCCRLLETADLLAPGAIIYLESDSSLENIALPDSWYLLKKSKAGHVYFGVCERLIH